MKISLNALKYYVDINVPVEELCDKMVMAGFEVESIECQGDNLKNVVVGRIEEIKPHENSDHIQICQINIGLEYDNRSCGKSQSLSGATWISNVQYRYQ